MHIEIIASSAALSSRQSTREFFIKLQRKMLLLCWWHCCCLFVCLNNDWQLMEKRNNRMRSANGFALTVTVEARHVTKWFCCEISIAVLTQSLSQLQFRLNQIGHFIKFILETSVRLSDCQSCVKFIAFAVGLSRRSDLSATWAGWTGSFLSRMFTRRVFCLVAVRWTRWLKSTVPDGYDTAQVRTGSHSPDRNRLPRWRLFAK